MNRTAMLMLTQPLRSNQSKSSILNSSALKIILCVLIGQLLLLLFSLHDILSHHSLNYSGAGSNIGAYLNTLVSKFNQSFDSMLQGRLAPAVVWAIMGSLFYAIYYFTLVILDKAQHDIVEIKHYRWTKPLSHRVGRHLTFVCLVLVFFVYSIVCLKTLLPTLSKMAYVAVFDSSFPLGIFEFLSTLLVTTLVIYLLFVLSKDLVSKLRWL